MKVTVVGYWHAYPEKGEAASGYLIEEENYRVLIDCGSGVVAQLQYYCDLKELDALVVSHYHNDHIGDLGALHYFRLLQPYISDEKIKPFTIFGHQDDKSGFAKLSYKDVVSASPYEAGQPVQIGPFTFSFYPTCHAVPCYAMKVETEKAALFYTADTSYSETLAQAAAGTDLLIAECSLYKGQDGKKAGHMNSEEAGRMARTAKAPLLLLSHLPHFGDHQQLAAEAAKECPGTKVELASSGWQKNI
ncbi:MBL fold metallo-hydrolase [Bacillus piscicola]|uniref:MBL fold metallo-hydrolase n=1 Tax=Bacillus piscicola TaxID=1632684 RepID=UPI001F09A677|nr:MBL fold metallo-hydrolase [Bacillus piscicola]